MSDAYGNLQKYRNPNAIQRLLIDHFLRRVSTIVDGLDFQTVLDAGCAEGFVSRYLSERVAKQLTITGVDLDMAALSRSSSVTPAMRRLVGDVKALPFVQGQFDLVLCTEVLEHLIAPMSAMQELRRVTGGYCLLSVPCEPCFRLMNFLRGRHVGRLGNDPEHLQNWTAPQFIRLVSESFKVVTTAIALPWSLVLGKKQ